MRTMFLQRGPVVTLGNKRECTQKESRCRFRHIRVTIFPPSAAVPSLHPLGELLPICRWNINERKSWRMRSQRLLRRGIYVSHTDNHAHTWRSPKRNEASLKRTLDFKFNEEPLDFRDCLGSVIGSRLLDSVSVFTLWTLPGSLALSASSHLTWAFWRLSFGLRSSWIRKVSFAPICGRNSMVCGLTTCGWHPLCCCAPSRDSTITSKSCWSWRDSQRWLRRRNFSKKNIFRDTWNPDAACKLYKRLWNSADVETMSSGDDVVRCTIYREWCGWGPEASPVCDEVPENWCGRRRKPSSKNWRSSDNSIRSGDEQKNDVTSEKHHWRRHCPARVDDGHVQNRIGQQHGHHQWFHGDFQEWVEGDESNVKNSETKRRGSEPKPSKGRKSWQKKRRRAPGTRRENKQRFVGKSRKCRRRWPRWSWVTVVLSAVMSTRTWSGIAHSRQASRIDNKFGFWVTDCSMRELTEFNDSQVLTILDRLLNAFLPQELEDVIDWMCSNDNQSTPSEKTRLAFG